MASKLRKYKYKGSCDSRPDTPSTQSSASDRDRTPDPPDMPDVEELKSQILTSLKADISAVIRTELKNSLADDFNFLKSELQAVRTEIANNATLMRTDIEQMKTTIKDMEGSMSTWTDEVNELQAVVGTLKSELKELRDKSEDMEGRMRRCNIRIVGVAEGPGSASTQSVSKLLSEALKLDKEVLVDRSHRSLRPLIPGGKPRVIVAKLHYYQDCVEVLRRARCQAPLQLNGNSISIFPDYTASVAKARAAFTDVRSLLREQRGVRYGLLFPARLRITHNGADREFLDPDKAMAHVKKYIVAGDDTGK